MYLLASAQPFGGPKTDKKGRRESPSSVPHCNRPVRNLQIPPNQLPLHTQTLFPMLFFKAFALLFTASAAIAAKCNGNNCDRAVNGTAQGTLARNSRIAACSTNIACTVTPAASITTITQHSTNGGTCSITTISASPSPTTSCGTQIDPAVKDACSNSFERYKAACTNCAGVTVSSTNAPAPAPTTATVIRYNCPCPTGGTCPGGVGQFTPCGAVNSHCLCFTGDDQGNTFCGRNFDPPCSAQTTCTTNADCVGSGRVCAHNTCCGSVCAAVCN